MAGRIPEPADEMHEEKTRITDTVFLTMGASVLGRELRFRLLNPSPGEDSARAATYRASTSGFDLAIDGGCGR